MHFACVHGSIEDREGLLSEVEGLLSQVEMAESKIVCNYCTLEQPFSNCYSIAKARASSQDSNQMTACAGLLAMLARRAGGNSNNRKEHKTYNSAEPCQATKANPEGKWRCAKCNKLQSRVYRLSQAHPSLVTGYTELKPEERAKFCKDCSSRFAQPQNKELYCSPAHMHYLVFLMLLPLSGLSWSVFCSLYFCLCLSLSLSSSLSLYPPSSVSDHVSV